MREVKPRVMPDGSVYYPNPPAWVLLALLPLSGLAGILIALPYAMHVFTPFGVVCIGSTVYVVGLLIILYLTSLRLVTGVEVGHDHVVLKHMFKKRRLTAEDVKKIILNPPVLSDSLKYRYWGELDSVITIEFESGEKLVTSLFPNGVKLRMARVLDPETYPLSE